MPTSLSPRVKMEFLRAKADAISGHARDEQGRVTLMALFAGIGGNAQSPPLPAEAIRRSDTLLEEIVAVFNPEIRKQIEEKLRQQFGITRLGKAPKILDDLIAKVLKSGKIRTNEDARLIGEFVSYTTNIEVVGAEAYRRLAAILDQYQGEASRSPRRTKAGSNQCGD